MGLCSETFFDLSRSRLGSVLEGIYPWAILADLRALLISLGERLPSRGFWRVGEDVWIARDAKVSDSAEIVGPCIIGEGAEVRRGAYIRGAALIGNRCVVGNASEIKNAILFDGATAPHFNYIGDSIVGADVHLGAGVILSNLRGDREEVIVRATPPIPTGRRKCGAVIGDKCEIGCGAVVNPGTVIGRGSTVYPLVSVSGVWADGSRIRTRRE